MLSSLPDMNLAEALRAEHSKAQTLRIVDWVGGDPLRFAELFSVFRCGDMLLEQRAAWAVGYCVEAHPGLLEPHLAAMLDNLERTGLHPAVIRASFRAFQIVPIPGHLEGRVLAAAFAALGGEAPIAVKAYSITIARRLAEPYPELLEEARLLVESQLPGAAPALRARARREFPTKKQGKRTKADRELEEW